MEILIGEKRRATFPKQFCLDNNINIGDKFELTYSNGDIILKSLNNKNDKLVEEDFNNNSYHEDTTVNVEEIVNNTEDTNIIVRAKNTNEYIKINPNSKIKSNLVESESFKKKYYSECGLVCRTKSLYLRQLCDKCKGELIDESVRGKYCPFADKCESSDNTIEEKEEVINNDIIENNQIMIDNNVNDTFGDSKEGNTIIDKNVDNDKDVADKNKNVNSLLELSKIPLNKFSKFQPNLIETLNNTVKYYSECGLVCSSTDKSRTLFCKNCKGDMLDISVRQKYCPYYLKSFSENNCNKVDKIKSNNNILSSIKKNVDTINNNIDIEIKSLDDTKDKKYNKDVNNNRGRDITEDLTTIRIISYSHHHQCYNCDEYYTTGFIIDDLHFYCKNCSANLFKEYMKERGRLKNV